MDRGLIMSMNYFTDKNGQVWGLDDEDVANGHADGLTPINEAEAMAIVNPPPTPEQVLANFRAERDMLLTKLDRPLWLASLTTDQRAEVDVYYQALLVAPDSVPLTMPTAPSWMK